MTLLTALDSICRWVHIYIRELYKLKKGSRKNVYLHPYLLCFNHRTYDPPPCTLSPKMGGQRSLAPSPELLCMCVGCRRRKPGSGWHSVRMSLGCSY
eukprot:1858719-Pyramimonas_sp.AAC.1